jgi:hypothetical protein
MGKAARLCHGQAFPRFFPSQQSNPDQDSSLKSPLSNWDARAAKLLHETQACSNECSDQILFLFYQKGQAVRD